MIEKPMTPADMLLEQPAEVELPDLTDAILTPMEDGGMEVLLGPEIPEDVEFSANLAEYMDDQELSLLASDLIEEFEADRSSRSDWEKAYVRGLDLLGMKTEDRTIPWPGATGVYHPLLMEAVVRFQAQAIMEIFPAAGPVKTQIVGKLTEAKEKQAFRVQEEMNFQLTEQMPEYRFETERLLFSLALAGSAFRKVYFDPIQQRPMAMFVAAQDFVVSYGSSDLRTCPRYTQVMKKPKNELRKLQVVGFYRDVDLPEPSPSYTDTEDKQQRIQGDTPTMESDDRYTLLEMHVDRDLAGFEDRDDDGEETGIGLPYIITIEKESSTVLSIRRNWNEGDPLKQRRQHFVPYEYLTGLGFYGYGLIHLVGGLAKSATSILRQLVDAGTLSNLPGGLKARGLRIKGDDSPIMPGEFRDVDIPGGSIRDNIAFIPYKEPSVVLYQLLGNIVDEGKAMASVADLKIGDMKQEAPVGTTLAIIERSLKVMSAVQARLHASLRQEFKLLKNVIKDYLPAPYDYEVDDPQASRHEDFERVNVVPVSDPNATTMAQRIMQYQAAIQLAGQAPQIYDLPALHRDFNMALGIPNVDKIIPSREAQFPLDPVSENMAILVGKPVKAFQYQDQDAHIATHIAAMSDPKIIQMVQQSPNGGAVQAAAMAHVAEHLAFKYRAEIEKQMGVPLPPPGQPLPPEVEVQLSQMVAIAAGRLLQKDQREAAAQAAAAAAQDPVVQQQQMDLQLRALEIERKRRKDDADAFFEAARLALDAEKAGKQTEAADARLLLDAATRGLDSHHKAEDRRTQETVAELQADVQKFIAKMNANRPAAPKKD